MTPRPTFPRRLPQPGLGFPDGSRSLQCGWEGSGRPVGPSASFGVGSRGKNIFSRNDQVDRGRDSFRKIMSRPDDQVQPANCTSASAAAPEGPVGAFGTMEPPAEAGRGWKGGGVPGVPRGPARSRGAPATRSTPTARPASKERIGKFPGDPSRR